MAAGALGKAVLGDEAAGEDAVAEAVLRADPDALARVREAEFGFMAKMKELDIDLERIHGADRASARQREMTLGGYANPALAGVVIARFFGTVGYVLTGQAQVESALAGALVGYVSAKAEQVIAYYFGSSSGSKQKTEIMGKAFGRGG
jgi:hypothetical protein